jgi:hypothetical protein
MSEHVGAMLKVKGDYIKHSAKSIKGVFTPSAPKVPKCSLNIKSPISLADDHNY